MIFMGVLRVPQETDQYKVIELERERGLHRLLIKTPDGDWRCMDGTALATIVDLPQQVRIRKIGFIHTTADPTVRSADPITYYVDAYPWAQDVAGLRLDAYTGVAGSYFTKMAEGYEEPTERLIFSSNSTLNDRVYYFIDIQILGGNI